MLPHFSRNNNVFNVFQVLSSVKDHADKNCFAVLLRSHDRNANFTLGHLKFL